VSILIRGARLGKEQQDILIEGNRITRIAAKIHGKAEHILEANGKAVFPGFYNTHTHAAMTLFRSYGDDMKLQQWLTEKIWPVEEKLTATEVYAGAKLACLEMLKSGTVFFNDMYFHHLETARAAAELGMRAAIGDTFLDVLLRDTPENIKSRVQKTFAAMEEYPLTIPVLFPHSIYTVNTENLLLIKELAEKYNCRMHIHLSETEQEVKDCLSKNGKGPVEYLKTLGILSPNLTIAHVVWLREAEIQTLAEHQVSVAHCPTSNMKLAVGSALPYALLRKYGVNVTLGTDGCASNNTLDMTQTMKFAALLAKHAAHDPTMLPAAEALQMATRNGAKAFGIDAGIVEEGRIADLVLVDLKRPEFTPLHDVTANLVYAANGSCVDSVICNGKIIMQERKVEGEEQILAAAEEAKGRLFG